MTGQRQRNTGFRLWLILLGIALFFWLGKEDSDVVAVTALGLILAGSTVWWLIFLRRRSDIRASGKPCAYLGILGGICVGALSSFFAALLMLLKDLRHGHIFPDYPPELIIATLERLPAWSLAGGLIGLGVSLLFGVCVGARGRNQ
ncbi:MAG: hypothetical protein OXN94_05555 [Chloroflexota bacterium]|nr:hypothetical protein [Chloroflexota bacterium]MDE2857296.1 hypothetical protein [Chloroflexota bacterium]MDE2951844.1 hypothetical protein [Chloroflexota bacterium]